MAIQMDATWSALVDPTRRRIVEMLAAEPMRAGAVADAFPSAGPTISRHLGVLKHAGLIEETRVDGDARVKVYQLRREPFGDLGAWVDQVQAHWRNQLDAFASHLEETQRKGREND
jgi:DNA-binding transcriptional ArsR family regulator